MELDPQYPVTRLQAARWLRSNQIRKNFKGNTMIEVIIDKDRISKKIRCRMWGGLGAWWIHLSWKQLLGFIRRNYARNYEGLT